jgi:hypothetical protein
LPRDLRFPTRGAGGPTGRGARAPSVCFDAIVRRSLRAAVAAALAGLGFAACSSNPSNPPQLGPSCEFADASCPGSVIGGGISGGGGDAGGGTGGACTVNASDAQCTQCADTNCCTSFSVCGPMTACGILLGCEQSCDGAAACIDSCVSVNMTAVPALNTLEACVEAKCPVCNEFGTGDPCGQGQTCNPGLSCSGLWCTKACVRSTDCAGLGVSGGNTLGLPNACIAGQCSPGCAADTDCSDFPGSFCFATTSFDALSVRVCSAPPDAGGD